jgi:hypothetical protein
MRELGSFHEVLGPEKTKLPKHTRSKEFGAQVIQSFLKDGEHYSWDGPYNTKAQPIATFQGQSLGRVFVTSERLLFWPDELLKPHLGLSYKDIQGWKSSWLPMSSRGVIMIVNNQQYIWAGAKTAIRHAEQFINGNNK